MTKNASLSALYSPTHNPHRLANYIDYEHSLNVEGLNFPVETKQIPLFEILNPSISVNVLAFEESSKGFTVEYRSPEREREHHVNLLFSKTPTIPQNDITSGLKICPHSFLTEPIRIIAHSSAIVVCTPSRLSECSTPTYRTVFNTSLNRSSIRISKTKRSAY